MSESLRRLHGLEFFLRSGQPAKFDGVGVQACILDSATHINFRGDAENARILDGVEAALGQPLPLEPNTVSRGEHRIYWLGPNEWLIVSIAIKASGLVAGLQDGLMNLHVSVNDVSGGQVTIRLEGDAVRDTLSKGCPIDFHADSFGPGDCAQSGLAKATVLIGCFDRPTTFELIVRRSFADYVARWLQQAGRDVGIEFQ